MPYTKMGHSEHPFGGCTFWTGLWLGFHRCVQSNATRSKTTTDGGRWGRRAGLGCTLAEHERPLQVGLPSLKRSFFGKKFPSPSKKIDNVPIRDTRFESIGFLIGILDSIRIPKLHDPVLLAFQILKRVFQNLPVSLFESFFVETVLISRRDFLCSSQSVGISFRVPLCAPVRVRTFST